MPRRIPGLPLPDAGAVGGPRISQRAARLEMRNPPICPMPRSLTPRPWRPRPAPPMRRDLRRALRLGRAWLLPRHWEGPYVLAATPGGPTLWRLTAQGAARRRPEMVRLRAGWRAAPARAAETRALRTALAALFPTEILVRRRQDLYALLYAAAEGEVIVRIPSVARPGSVFAGLRPVPGRGAAEIWDGGIRRARIEGRDIPPALLRLEMAHEGAPLVVCPLPPRSRHRRLQAIHVLAERLGLPHDDPFLRWIASA